MGAVPEGGEAVMDLQERMKRFEETCRRQGLPVTVQRRAVYEALASRKDHPTADELYDAVSRRLPGISRTTVYRVLETLVKMGLAIKVDHPGARSRFDANATDHPHAVCLACERVFDFEVRDFDLGDIPEQLPDGFQVTGVTVVVHGYCPFCRAALEKNRG